MHFYLQNNLQTVVNFYFVYKNVVIVIIQLDMFFVVVVGELRIDERNKFRRIT